MESQAFRHWCVEAVDRIRFRPDRERVYAELYAHLEDGAAAFLEAGLRREEAEKRALAAMGSAEETALQLEKIHRPFWGYALRAARVLLLVAALAALFLLPRFVRLQGVRAEESSIWSSDVYAAGTTENDGWREERVFYAEPMVSDGADGWRFTLTRAAGRRNEGFLDDGTPFTEERFFLTVEAANLRPWALRSDVLREFYAVDSLGMVYPASNRSGYDAKSPCLAGNPRRSGLFTVTWDMWLSGYRSQGADWIELRYDRGGRDVRLRVALRGGDAP